MNAFGRLATPKTPFMDNLYLDSHFWAVPIRLLDDNWQKLNGEQRNPGDSTDYLVPEITSPAGGYAVQSLSDYFGIPPLWLTLPRWPTSTVGITLSGTNIIVTKTSKTLSLSLLVQAPTIERLQAPPAR